MLHFFSTQRTAFLIIFAVLGTVTVINDPDYYFHLVAGEYILAHNTLPHVDVFSFTMAGEPWHMHEWLFEVLMAQLYALGGEGVIVWVIAAIGIWPGYLLFRVGVDRSEGRILWLAPALVLLLFYLPFIKQRPQVITFAAFAVYLAVLLAFKYRGQWRGLLLLPVIMLFWVNSHGGYLLGIAVTGLFTASEWWLWWRTERAGEKSDQLHILLWVLVATVLASLANPYFIAHWWFPFELMNLEAMNVISEWQRPDYSEPFFQGYLLCVVLFVGHYLTQKKSPDLTEWLLPGGMIIASLSAARHVPLAALCMLPFFLLTLKRPSYLWPLLTRWGQIKTGTAPELGIRENIFNIGLLMLTLLLLFAFSPALKVKQQQLKEHLLPVKAVDFLEQNDLYGRLFNQYRHSGYLLYRLYPRQRVFIDIRADMYGDAMMRDYTTIFFATQGWEEVFDHYHFDIVLCELGAPLVEHLLKRNDFRLVYRDVYNVILQRKAARLTDGTGPVDAGYRATYQDAESAPPVATTHPADIPDFF
jgi:hypothetical protein